MRMTSTYVRVFVSILLTGCMAAPAWGQGGPAPAEALPVQMLVPGFVVRELPVKLTNINNLEYLPDGRLLAVGYDGRVHVLEDTDGDGLEDKAAIWWQDEKNPFRGPIGAYLAPEGLYVPSKGKLSLVNDTDGDGVADREQIVATGWTEIFQAVDCTGVTKDAEGNIYFSLGCANFANAYLLDEKGKAHYDINSERGTIIKLSPDWKERQIVATGVRFAIGIAFNRHGDLFWTDQEGDTWTKGNHLDELNVLMPGRRHYGFPERHPVHLPDVIDEPPVVGFGPQHQSTCGLIFNDELPTRRRFGPEIWEGDAIVTGEARGKLWRATVVKTEKGYVGFRPHAIARLEMLTVGCTISPQGDLVVCCHSGPPDWGTGPQGMGRIFKISYVDRSAPQPVAAWASGPGEVRVAFDRAIDESVLGRLGGVTLEAGEFVRAADRIEVLRPPYEVVKQQLATGWKNVKVSGGTLSADGRTMILTTEKLPWRSWYAVGIPGVKARGASGLGETVDVDFDLSGLEATWTSKDGSQSWTGWVPHPDPEVIRELLKGSSEHERLLKLLSEDGQIAYDGYVGLPGGGGTVRIEMPGEPASITTQAEATRFSFGAATGGGKQLELTTSYSIETDPIERPIPVEALVVPWAPQERQEIRPLENVQSPLVAGGDWEKGRELFFGEAKCSTCHMVGGEGGTIGPNLSNLVHLDPESVLTHIVEPNLTINPDYVSYLVRLKNGESVAGLVHEQGDGYRIVESAEEVKVISRGEVERIRPSDVSIMPEGYGELGEEKLRDLLMFLTQAK